METTTTTTTITMMETTRTTITTTTKTTKNPTTEKSAVVNVSEVNNDGNDHNMNNNDDHDEQYEQQLLEYNHDNTNLNIPNDMECVVTMEEIDNSNYVEYLCYPSFIWKPCLMEQSVVEELLKTQFYNYINETKTTDCQATLKRLLIKGPPIYISDKIGLPLNNDTNDDDNKEDNDDDKNTTTENNNNDTHICALWYSSDQKIHSSKLHGAVVGIHRQQLWNELKEYDFS